MHFLSVYASMSCGQWQSDYILVSKRGRMKFCACASPTLVAPRCHKVKPQFWIFWIWQRIIFQIIIQSEWTKYCFEEKSMCYTLPLVPDLHLKNSKRYEAMHLKISQCSKKRLPQNSKENDTQIPISWTLNQCVILLKI